jgi:hypothetical protein
MIKQTWKLTSVHSHGVKMATELHHPEGRTDQAASLQILFHVRSEPGKGMSIKVSVCIRLEHIFWISGPTVLHITIRTGE